MTRILSYNILVGGTKRAEKLARIIDSAQADIVGLVEATDAGVVETLAEQLGLHMSISGRGKHNRDWQVALLSRYPILATKVHTYPDIFTRRHLLEVTVEEPDGNALTLFVVHLTADFFSGQAGNIKRRAEVQKALAIMSAKRGTPHLFMGDFNSVAPGEPVHGSKLMRYMMREREKYYQQLAAMPNYHPAPNQESIFRSFILLPILRALIYSRPLSALLDRLSPRYAQGGIDLLQREGYVDCFRTINPRAPGFTCPAGALAGRIDFIFASPELASRLTFSDVISEGNGVRGEEASDHLPVLAEFR